MSFRSMDLEVCETDEAAQVFEMPINVPVLRSKKDMLLSSSSQLTHAVDNNRNNITQWSGSSNAVLNIPFRPNPNNPNGAYPSSGEVTILDQLGATFGNSPAMLSLCVALGSGKELSRLICVSRECRRLLEGDEVNDANSKGYVYHEISKQVFKIPFQIDKLSAKLALRRWESFQVYWRPIRGAATPYWLVRGADGNNVGEHLRKRVFAFGGSSVAGDSYSKTLYELFWTTRDTITHEEVNAPMDHSFPSRAACGFVQTQDKVCYVFGGRSGTHYLDDLWSFKVRDHISWVPYVSQHSSPAPRWAHSMISIGRRGFLLYGGSAPGRLFGDLWYFNGAQWSELEQSEKRPHERAGHAVAIVPDGKIDWLYVYGGNTAGPVVETYSDLWRLPLSCDDEKCTLKGAWQRVNVVGPPLTPRIGHSLTLCGTRLVIFGGRNLSATNDQQFAAAMDVINLEQQRNTVIPVPTEVRRTGHFVLNHPEGLVFAAGLSANRHISATVLCCFV